MSHQPEYSYQPLLLSIYGGNTDPDKTRRLLGQQNVSDSNDQVLPQSHGDNTDPDETRRKLRQHLLGLPQPPSRATNYPQVSS